MLKTNVSLDLKKEFLDELFSQMDSKNEGLVDKEAFSHFAKEHPHHAQLILNSLKKQQKERQRLRTRRDTMLIKLGTERRKSRAQLTETISV